MIAIAVLEIARQIWLTHVRHCKFQCHSIFEIYHSACFLPSMSRLLPADARLGIKELSEVLSLKSQDERNCLTPVNFNPIRLTKFQSHYPPYDYLETGDYATCLINAGDAKRRRRSMIL